MSIFEPFHLNVRCQMQMTGLSVVQLGGKGAHAPDATSRGVPNLPKRDKIWTNQLRSLFTVVCRKVVSKTEKVFEYSLLSAKWVLALGNGVLLVRNAVVLLKTDFKNDGALQAACKGH